MSRLLNKTNLLNALAICLIVLDNALSTHILSVEVESITLAVLNIVGRVLSSRLRSDSESTLSN